MRPNEPRPQVVGPDAGPEPPFPLKLNGKVIKGFGRGSKELGIPTANIPIEGLTVGGHTDIESGVYYGWAGLDFTRTQPDANPSAQSTAPSSAVESHKTSGKLKHLGAKVAGEVGEVLIGSGDEASHEDRDAEGKGKGEVYPMVMSIGWNPYYKNEKRSVEVHILHQFAEDFYGSHMNLLILGFIRPEYDYVSKEALIEDIKTDIDVTGRCLARPAYAQYRKDPYLTTYNGPEHTGEVAS